MASSATILRGRHRPGAQSTGRAAGDLLKRWWSAFWAARARRSTVALLHGLDDRTLQDIGV